MKARYFATLLASAALFSVPALAQQSGKDVYSKVCATCHATGLAGAPRYGNAADWNARAGGGVGRFYQSALQGTAKGMPAKGGHMTLSDGEVKGAVDYMLAAVKDGLKLGKAEEAAPAKAETKPEPKPEPKKAEAKPAPTPAPAPAPAQQSPVAASAPAAIAAAAAAAPSGGDVNAFNRMLKPAGKRNLPPPEDGIHDPTVDGTHALQPPLAAFGTLPKSFAGNRVNWVEALDKNKISPRADRQDPNAVPVVMDLNVVREVKGSMPDVVYPHKQHTEWLDCSNCHPAIFNPQKGSNVISMAAILLGEKCGVCHGKVAFPVSECRLCHSKKKEMPAATAQGK